MEKQRIQLKTAKKRVITAICFALPLLYISMGHMVPFPLAPSGVYGYGDRTYGICPCPAFSDRCCIDLRPEVLCC